MKHYCDVNTTFSNYFTIWGNPDDFNCSQNILNIVYFYLKINHPLEYPVCFNVFFSFSAHFISFTFGCYRILCKHPTLKWFTDRDYM